MGAWDEPVGRTVGRRRQPRIAFTASARLLRRGARFNEEFHRLPAGRLTAIAKGLHAFRTHKEANRFDEECLAARMAEFSKRGA